MIYFAHEPGPNIAVSKEVVFTKGAPGDLEMKTRMMLNTFIGVALISGCGGVKFSTGTLPAGNNSNSSNPVVNPGGGCQLKNLNRPVKVMFVVDTSGSNNSSTTDDGTVGCTSSNQNCAPATDPLKTFRSGSITSFFNTFKAKTNFSWGFEVFSGTIAQPYISTNGQSATFGNASAMASAITQFNSETDNNGTPYLAALSEAHSAIASDPDLNSTNPYLPLYFIVFMSDGYPTDALSGSNPVVVDTGALNSSISSILSLAPGRITFSSIYYGTINDPNAAGTLQGMATVGQGQFVNVNTGSTSSIVINDLITVPVGQCQ
jgi:hypothetical protein